MHLEYIYTNKQRVKSLATSQGCGSYSEGHNELNPWSLVMLTAGYIPGHWSYVIPGCDSYPWQLVRGVVYTRLYPVQRSCVIPGWGSFSEQRRVKSMATGHGCVLYSGQQWVKSLVTAQV